MLTPKQLTDQVVEGVDFETLSGHLKPLIGKYSRWRVPGFEPEDIRQELLIVLWNCQKAYNPTKGSFLVLVIRSFENAMGKMRARARRNMRVLALQCKTPGCEVRVAPRSRGGTCHACGGRRWKADYSPHQHASLDELLDGAERESTRKQPFEAQDTSVHFDLDLEVNDQLVKLLAEADEQQLEIAKRFLLGDKIKAKELRRLQSLVA